MCVCVIKIIPSLQSLPAVGEMGLRLEWRREKPSTQSQEGERREREEREGGGKERGGVEREGREEGGGGEGRSGSKRTMTGSEGYRLALWESRGTLQGNTNSVKQLSEWPRINSTLKP